MCFLGLKRGHSRVIYTPNHTSGHISFEGRVSCGRYEGYGRVEVAARDAGGYKILMSDLVISMPFLWGWGVIGLCVVHYKARSCSITLVTLSAFTTYHIYIHTIYMVHYKA